MSDDLPTLERPMKANSGYLGGGQPSKLTAELMYSELVILALVLHLRRSATSGSIITPPCTTSSLRPRGVKMGHVFASSPLSSSSSSSSPSP
jgi:hypothetical protein